MTEKDGHGILSLLLGALTVLVPIALLGVIAAVGGGAPHGRQGGLFTVPIVVLAGVLLVGALLVHRERRAG